MSNTDWIGIAAVISAIMSGVAAILTVILGVRTGEKVTNVHQALNGMNEQLRNEALQAGTVSEKLKAVEQKLEDSNVSKRPAV